MKKIKLLFLVVLFALITITFSYPTIVHGLEEETHLININAIERFKVGNLYFSNLKFKNHANTSARAIGLTGIIENKSEESVGYKAIVSYYDKDYNIIGESYITNDAIPGISNFNFMSDLSIINGHAVDEISYYKLTFEILDNDYNSEQKEEEDYNLYSGKDYILDKYDVNIVVNENNTLDITETITAYFNIEKHGIIRNIPLKNTVNRLDGTQYVNKTQVYNLKVNDKYKTSKKNGIYSIKIGSNYQTYKGEKVYEIKYTYNLGNDPLKDIDELYFNIIGNEWDTVIRNITFTINMPKEFDSSKLGFSSGTIGSTQNDNIKYNVQGNTISGSYNGTLREREGLTVRLELPEGYFVGAKLKLDYTLCLMFIIPIVFLLYAVYTWHKYGRDDKVIETVEFYPPEGKNSLEVGFLYNGGADSKDVTSLLIYLANKGYIKITETNEISKKTNEKVFKITKLKEYDGNDINEQLFLAGLFVPKYSYDSLLKSDDELLKGRTEITSDDLYNNFYRTNYKILSNINAEENRKKILYENNYKRICTFLIMLIIIICLITIPPYNMYGSPELKSLSIFYTLLAYFPLTAFLINKTDLSSTNKNTNIVSNIITKLFIVAAFGVAPFCLLILPSLLPEKIYLVSYISGIICYVGIVICFLNLDKRTKYGNEMLGKIEGFKNFLETVEKEKLEAMVTENPTYFYDILPYTYVLGISDKWISKFSSITLQKPTWYEGTSSFNNSTMESFISSTMHSMNSSMSSSPSVSSSSGSSGGGSTGGGSSGGGSGGGGGSSW